MLQQPFAENDSRTKKFYCLRSFEHEVWLLEQTKKVLSVYNDKVYDKYDRYPEMNRPLGHYSNRYDKLFQSIYNAGNAQETNLRSAFLGFAS